MINWFFKRFNKKKYYSKSKKNIKRNNYLLHINKLKKTIPEWDTFFCDDKSKSIEENNEIRGNNWIRLEVLGQTLLEKYSWAIPDERSLRILANYSPLIEIGITSIYIIITYYINYQCLIINHSNVFVIISCITLYIGAGKGYWAKMLSNRNIDILAFDKYIDKDRWFNVLKGNSNILNKRLAEGRNLFLCYPDDSQSLGR